MDTHRNVVNVFKKSSTSEAQRHYVHNNITLTVNHSQISKDKLIKMKKVVIFTWDWWGSQNGYFQFKTVTPKVFMIMYSPHGL